jgi:hypothetical protein
VAETSEFIFSPVSRRLFQPPPKLRNRPICYRKAKGEGSAEDKNRNASNLFAKSRISWPKFHRKHGLNSVS